MSMNCVDYATLTVSSSAVGLASASPALAAGAVSGTTVTRAVITVETDQVRWRADGTAPTSAEGHLMNAGDSLNLTDDNYSSVLAAIQFIRVTADAKLKITYFGL